MNHPFYSSPGLISLEDARKLSAEDKMRLMEQALAEYGDGQDGAA
jgi:hypothetical protein